MKYTSLLSAGLLTWTLGCGSPGEAVDDTPRNPDVTDPGGMMGNVDYPKGNIGFTVGQQVANLSFLWKEQGMLDAGKDPERITLADFYALRKQGAKLLVLVGSAEWCNPCRIEAEQMQRAFTDPAFLSYLDSKGGRNALQLVQVMFQNADYSRATKETIDRWAGDLKVTFPVGIDPLSQVSQYIPENAIPQTLFIDLKDMTLAGREVGASTEAGAMEAKLKSYLNKVAP